MKAKAPLKIDLNNLFQPAITDGPKQIESFHEKFSEIYKGMHVLRSTGQLGYAVLPEEDILTPVLELKKNFKDLDNVILFGIGGSALGPLSIYDSIRGPFAQTLKDKNHPQLFVMDNIDPNLYPDLIAATKNKNNAFIFISKSGNTSETLAQLLFAKKHFELSKENTVIITDPENGFLRKYASDNNFQTLPVPPIVGGRFSVFSAVGLLPLALANIDVEELVNGAKHMEDHCRKDILEQNPAGLIAMTWDYWLQEKSLSQVVMLPYSTRLRYVSDWFAQLFGESLGKRHDLSGNEVFTGYTPIKAVGVTDQHSQLQLYLHGPRDKVVTFIEVDHYQENGLFSDENLNDERVDFLSGKTFANLMEAEKLGTEASLTQNDRPNMTIHMSEINEFQLGQLYQLFMNVTPMLGALNNINTFDQPAVEQIKQFTFGLMGRPGFESFKEDLKKQEKRADLIFS